MICPKCGEDAVREVTWYDGDEYHGKRYCINCDYKVKIKK